MAAWTLTLAELINYFSALTGAKVSADVSELVKDLHINRSEETYPYLAPVGIGSTLIQLVRGFPATTGGQKIAPLFQSITTDGTDYTATDAGVITQIPAKDFTLSLLNALGVSITDLSAGVWTGVCNALSNIYGREVTLENIGDFRVLAVVQNGSLMFDEATIKAWSDALSAEDFFSRGGYVQTLDDVTTGRHEFNEFTYNSELFLLLKQLLTTMYAENTIPYPYTDANLLSIVNDFMTSIGDYDISAKPVVIYASYVSFSENLTLSLKIFKNLDYVPVNRDGTLLPGYHSANVVLYASSTLYGYTYNLRTGAKTSEGDSGSAYHYTTDINTGFKELYASNINYVKEETIDGIEIQTGATLPTDDLDLPSEYPAWASAGVSAGFWDDAASLLRTRKMIPVALQEEGEVYVTPQALARDGVVDHAGTKAKTKILDGAVDVLDTPTDWVDEGTRTIPLDVPTSPEPMNTDTPVVVLPTGTAGGPVTVYNPTQAQMDSLRTELWNNGLVVTLQTLFNANPMDAIISCHMIYASPHVDATKKGLYLGNVFMNVSGVNVVDEQFIEVDCGTVSVPELFGNATDYEPYTSVEIYLPFIGIQQLSANDVVGGSVSLVMKEDVLTGAILAEVTVTKNGSTQTLYQFTGNGAVQIPLTGQDRLSQIMGGIKGALSGGFTGGVAGAVMGTASGAIASKPSIMKSGGFSPNTGAMAGKLPYLIINRNIPLDASEYNKFTGYPSNKKVNLGSVSGFTRVKDVHVEGIICTEQEKTLIEEALKEGIFL